LLSFGLLGVAKKATAQAVLVGSYVGNGTGQTISTGTSTLSVLIIKASGQSAFIKTSAMAANESKDMTAAAAPVTDAITAFSGNTFTLSTNAGVNTNGTT